MGSNFTTMTKEEMVDMLLTINPLQIK